MAMNPRLLRPLATGFNPRQIAGLALWFDADDDSTITLNGSTVSAWADKSGNGRHATQATPANQPIYSTAALGGKNVVTTHPDKARFMKTAAFPAGLPQTVFLVADSNGTNQGFFQRGTVNSLHACWRSSTAFIARRGGSKDAQVAPATNGYKIFTCVFSNTLTRLRVDGEQGTDDTATASGAEISTGDHTLALFNLDSLFGLDGGIAEFAYYDAELTPSQIQRVEGYLAWKWGLQAQLPYDHPYARSFPGFGSQTVPTDPDAQTYLAAVAAADGTGVEVGVANAVDDFVKGCKADGIWDSIKASCILAGARTLAGALVPLKTADELWDGTVVPGITALGGASATYDAATLTMNSLTTGTSGASPRFAFDLGLVTGRKYTISGRLSGDLNITNATAAVRAGSTGSVTYDQSTGEFSGTVAATDQYLWIYLDSTQGPGSVTIESMSIKETTAPTNNNFVSGDYDRETGLVGNGSTKYLDSNRANNADPQDSNHNAVYVTGAPSVTGFVSGNATLQSVGNNRIIFASGGTGHQFDSRSAASSSVTVAGGAETGFIGHARIDSASISYRLAGTTGTASQASATPNALNLFVFSRESGGLPTNARLAFYSIGESLDLEALDTRVSALITAIGAAI